MADRVYLGEGAQDRGGSILDCEDGPDLIDFTRNANVNGIADLEIIKTEPGLVTLSYLNEDEASVMFDAISAADFDLDSTDFLF